MKNNKREKEGRATQKKSNKILKIITKYGTAMAGRDRRGPPPALKKKK